VAGDLRGDPLHVRQPVIAGSCTPGRVSRCQHPRRRSRSADGVRAAVREQFLFRDHAPGRQSECHLRRERVLEQREPYRLGLPATLFFLAVFLVIGTGWILLVAG